jgi:hypothetical protein
MELWPSVPENSLTVLDRAFLAAGTLISLVRGGSNRHWLTRAKSNTHFRVIKKLGRGDSLVELDVSAEARRKDPSLPKQWTMRAIQCTRKGFRPQLLLTSLIDSERYPRDEVVGLYHERWELELGFDEIKTEMLEREEAIRSQTPLRVCQEVWGILLAYNLVRLEIERIADEEGSAYSYQFYGCLARDSPGVVLAEHESSRDDSRPVFKSYAPASRGSSFQRAARSGSIHAPSRSR